MNKKTLFFVAAGLVAVLALVAYTNNDETGDNTTAPLRVGTEGAYLPWNGVNSNGDVIGFEADLANEICTRTNLTCEFVKQDWDGIIPALLNNKYDVIMAGMTITDKRRETIDFSDGYADTGVAFASPTISVETDLEDLKESLKGKTIGVQKGTIAAVYARDNFPDSSINAYGTQDELNIDLMAGRIDAGVNDTSVWYALQKKEESVKIISPILTGKDDPSLGEGIGLGIGKGKEELLEKLNAALKSIKDDGTMSQLAIKWFGFDASM